MMFYAILIAFSLNVKILNYILRKKIDVREKTKAICEISTINEPEYVLVFQSA